jgi:hypothetical protein
MYTSGLFVILYKPIVYESAIGVPYAGFYRGSCSHETVL